jgi:RNA polymerase sigma factor (sigma-70 family)
MNAKDDETTQSSLLRRVGNWRDGDAWSQFIERYEPLIRRWVRRFGLDADQTEDLCQQIWVDLARRMPDYAYDHSRTFRGWLRRVCESRAIDLLRAIKAKPAGSLYEQQADPVAMVDPAFDDDEGDLDARRQDLLRRGRQAHDRVKGRVGWQTWQAFWHVAIDDWSVRATADALGMSYAAVFAAHKRVLQMLRHAGDQIDDD